MKETGNVDVRDILSDSRRKITDQNKTRLRHVIKVVELCGRQELPLRCHRDCGRFRTEEPDHNDGVFRSALRLRLDAADEAINDSFKNAPRNVSYISWQTQKKIISLFGNQIVKDVANVKFFSMLADETSDTGHVEQLSLSLRFEKTTRLIKNFYVSFDLLQPLWKL